ncbi:ABC transporter ATP-binding protein uup [Polystyrenella longa]|uniref:ATP-binding protein Uup n=1 Tax=Polystyrenella longa TaxID=2528007 RepID=A0A518CSG4_9PLAN|nr:ATP-binding cassette domain-containing protein [Polystyrenella longa]QDU82155.1 ABC transporter ATP-binding protein uup [Polystyrenella longa]
MSLISLNQVSFAWGGPLLLDNVNLVIERGEKIGLVGRNGAGKSTLMKMLTGEIHPDNGNILHDNNLVVSRLIQEVPVEETGLVRDMVSRGFDIESQSGQHSETEPEDWEKDIAIDTVLSRMRLDGDIPFETLSSGKKRRVLLAQALVREPDVLLLDEPTNHLDIEAITWLEQFLQNYGGTLIFVTHDRQFLQALTTRILELDRGRLFDWTCDYQTFLTRKEEALAVEQKQNELFDKKLAEEEVWIRKGIKARRTRNEGRVRALKSLRQERKQRREKVGNVRMEVAEAEKSGRLVLEAKNISFSYDNEQIIRDFSIVLTREDKVGIIGPNGAGKSTLLKLILGQLQPTTGSIREGTRLEVLYFDQLREQIEEEKTVVENVGEGTDTLLINGRQQHIYGYLQDFLFTPERARRPARFLSGGERNRLLLAKLFKNPSNVMVMDEPTNDLDAETLELLEELVSNYPGTLLLVSHDRAFLNNVVTSTLVFEGDGYVKEYAGGYDDYLFQKSSGQSSPQLVENESSDTPLDIAKPAEKKAKLSFKETRELERLTEEIAELEAKQAELHNTMAAPDFFKQDGPAIATATDKLQQLKEKLEAKYVRWEDLEARA